MRRDTDPRQSFQKESAMFPTAIRKAGVLALALGAGLLPSIPANAGVTQYCLGTTLVEVVRVAVEVVGF